MTQLRTHTSKVVILARGFFVCGFLASSWLASPASAATLTFSNPDGISIPDSGIASPYPSIISVSGIADPIAQVTVTVSGFSHSSPFDVGALLVGPGGQSTFLFDGPGSGTDAVNLTWTFDDNAAGPLPSGGALSSGTFTPNAYFAADDVFSSPAPAGPYPQTLSVFNGLSGASANGDWKLYIQDFVGLDSGSLSGGWSLAITTASAVPEPATLALFGLGLAGVVARRRRSTTST